jgi:hypothetical protein
MKSMNKAEQSLKWEEGRLETAALRMARRCRHVIQGCLREEEWGDADAEFYAVILSELKGLRRMRHNEMSDSHDDHP